MTAAMTPGQTGAAGGLTPATLPARIDPEADLRDQLRVAYGVSQHPEAAFAADIVTTVRGLSVAEGVNREAWLVQQGRNEMTARRLDNAEARMSHIEAFLSNSWVGTLAAGISVAFIAYLAYLYIEAGDFAHSRVIQGTIGAILASMVVITLIGLFRPHRVVEEDGPGQNGQVIEATATDQAATQRQPATQSRFSRWRNRNATRPTAVQPATPAQQPAATGSAAAS